MKVIAPGKIILSGEHAVVYGQPALAMAINRYTTTTISSHSPPHISFDLADLAHRSRLTLATLHRLKERVKRKYQKFRRGEYTIKQVLHKPFELAHIAFGILAERLNSPLPHGVNIQVQSDIPIGCGMGSSAATILSVMYAIAHYLELALSNEVLFQLALEAEHFQHGHSSGLDLRVTSQGGCIYMHEKAFSLRRAPEFPLYLVQTGTPQSTTGECVEKVSVHFQSLQLLNDFAYITNRMDQALQCDRWQDFQECVKQNHQLLTYLGVVPARIQAFINEIEQSTGAAKICGAGAVYGESAGIVMVLTEDHATLSQICSNYGYTMTLIHSENRGVHAA